MILAIGAIDSSGGAGLDQDRRTAERLNCPVRSAVTGLTVQGKKGVTAIHPSPKKILLEQLNTHLTEDAPDTIKIGALCEISQISLIRETLLSWKKNNKQVVIVADPVFKPTKGLAFLNDKAVKEYHSLFSIIDIITPNSKELSILSDCLITNIVEAELAGKRLSNAHNISVVVTGGHFVGPKLEERVIINETIWKYSKDRIALKQTHGTGCCLSTALAVYISRGFPIKKAFPLATNFVTKMLG